MTVRSFLYDFKTAVKKTPRMFFSPLLDSEETDKDKRAKPELGFLKIGRRRRAGNKTVDVYFSKRPRK